MIPTPEQQQATDIFMLGESMKINAFAGSGKTSTLKLLAREKVSPGVYLCFNRAIAEESAKTFPETVACKTTHSFAYRSVIGRYSRNKDKMTNSLRARDTVQTLGLKDFPIFGGTDRIDASTVGYAVNQTIRRYCQSAEREFASRHFENLPKFTTLPEDEWAGLKFKVLAYAKDLWEQAMDPLTSVPLGHDGYVKVWQLTDPVIDTCFILVDEAQDTNPVMLDILAQQSAQIVYVGDRHQQIYEWRGAVNAMEIVTVKHTVNLTKSFRFGQAIADHASDVLATIGETVRIEGNPLLESKLTREDQKVLLCRTNGQILDSLLTLEELEGGKSAYVAGGVNDLIQCIDGVERLQNRRASAYPMFIGFKDWQEFLLYAQQSGDNEAQKIVKLCDKYEINDLKKTLQNVMPDESRADFVFTTAHKSKGREWPGVQLAEDFKAQPEKDENGEYSFNGPETRLFYVASTRAINTLKVPAWALETYKSKLKEAA